MIAPLGCDESLSEHLTVKLPIIGAWIVGGSAVKLKSEAGNIIIIVKIRENERMNCIVNNSGLLLIISVSFQIVGVGQNYLINPKKTKSSNSYPELITIKFLSSIIL